MAYMELHQEFREHTKVKRLASAVGCSRAESRSMIVCLWTWAIGEARNGDVTKFTPEEIADACHTDEVSGKIEPVKLKKALISTSILDEKDSKILIHDWKSMGVRVLEQSRRRMSKYRRGKEFKEGTVTEPLRNCNDSLSLFLSLFPSLYPSLRTDRFARGWGDWVEHRKEKRKPLTDRQAQKQLAWLGGQPEPIACIDQSIRNGWQGLFELKVERARFTPVSDPPARRRSTWTCEKCGMEDHAQNHHCPEGPGMAVVGDLTKSKAFK